MLLIIFAGPKDLLGFILSIVDSTISLVPAISVLRLRVSALPLSFLGVYIILNLYYPNISKKIIRSEQLSVYTL
jgi:hypothetical protein